MAKKQRSIEVITTQAELRKLFWESHPQYKRAYVRISKPGHYYRPKQQNEYPADVRMAWVYFIDFCARNEVINEDLACRATLM